MNVHYCPNCARGFWTRADLGETEKLPKHNPPGEPRPCLGTGKQAGAVRPPGSS